MRVCVADIIACDYYVFTIDDDATMLKLKEKIADQINISVDRIGLLAYNGSYEVKNDDVLSTYGRKCATFDEFIDFKEHVEALYLSHAE